MKKSVWAAAGIIMPALLFCGCKESTPAVDEPAYTVGREQEIGEENEENSSLAVHADGVEGNLTVTFLDVGQGNAVLVENDGMYMLIDGGDREYASFVVRYLQNTGVEKLEYVISSHYDADHLNGVVGALHAFMCSNVLAADYTADTRVYDSFCEAVTEQDVTLVYPAAGDVYTFGDAEFTVVCPDSYTAADANDNSIGIRLVYGDNSFLICGDAGESAEEAMLQSGRVLDSDVYLASHHGSDGSSTREFLQAVSPEAVVFSVGADNSYGHPSERVLGDAAQIGADIYRTDVQGTIIAVSDGQKLTWNVAPVSEDAGTEQIQTPVAGESATYILNRNTKKIHLPSCSSAEEIDAENRAVFYGTKEELLGAGYEACRRCNP